MARPLWQTKRRIELAYKSAVYSLLSSTVNLYFKHKSEDAFLNAVTVWTAGKAFSNYANALTIRMNTIPLVTIKNNSV